MQRWWNQERDNFSLWTSEESVVDLSQGDYPNKDDIIDCIAKIPLLPPEPQVYEIAQIYIDNFLMPRALAGDAIHLAYASYYKMDFLPTWNCNHLVNANKKQHIRVINARLNLSVPEIITPLELFTEIPDDDE